MNRIPKTPAPNLNEVKRKEKEGYVTKVRQYKLITPLYGGGEEPAKPDSVTVIRGSEVRGHLRFWWRATRGGQEKFEGKLEKMKEEEERIWGSAAEKGKAGASRISISISEPKKGALIWKKEITVKDKRTKKEKKQQVDLADPKSPWSYVAFPLRKDDNKEAGSLTDSVSFTLNISYPKELANDIEAALWAWETFGGIGGRTRRGFGALQYSSSTVSIGDAQNKVKELLKKYVSSGEFPDGVPHLKPSMTIIAKKFSKPSDNEKTTASIKAWEFLFGSLQKFRQKRYDSKFGLSQWTEANEIRRLHKREAKIPKETSKIPLLQKFPRAKFGLPIQFNMPHDVGLPDTLILHGKQIDSKKDKWLDRLASPLILRPIECSDGAVGIALILEWKPIDEKDERYTPPGGLVLKNAPKDPSVKSTLTDAEAKQILPLNGNPDVLQAFLNFLGK